MIDGLKIRLAKIKDIDFLVEAVIEAEKSSTDMCSSCNIFSITENEFADILKKVFQENIEGHEYCHQGYLIAEVNNEYAGALGSWIEEKSGYPSGLLKANLLMNFIDKSKLIEVNRKTQIIKGLHFSKAKNSIQLEHGYTREKFRRQGVFSKLIKETIKYNFESNPGVTKVQGVLFKGNYKSYNAHLKLKFRISDEKQVDNPDILKIMPYNSKVMMELNNGEITNLINNSNI